MSIIPKRMKLPMFMLGLGIIDAAGLAYKYGLLAVHEEVVWPLLIGAAILFASIIIP